MILHIDLLTRGEIVILTDSFQDSDSFHALTHFPFIEISIIDNSLIHYELSKKIIHLSNLVCLGVLIYLNFTK